MPAKKKSPLKKTKVAPAKGAVKKTKRPVSAKKTSTAKKKAVATVGSTLKKLVKKVASALKVKAKSPKKVKTSKKQLTPKAASKKNIASSTSKKTIVTTQKKKSPSKETVKTTSSFPEKAKKTIIQKKPKAMPQKEAEKTSYSDAELEEFRQLINQKLAAAREELKYLQEQITRTTEIGDTEADTTFSGLEDGTGTMEREYLNQMASRLITYIGHLEKALVRIENKTYGICRETGKLIPKERLRAVPHATLSIEAKMAKD